MKSDVGICFCFLNPMQTEHHPCTSEGDFGSDLLASLGRGASSVPTLAATHQGAAHTRRENQLQLWIEKKLVLLWLMSAGLGQGWPPLS